MMPHELELADLAGEIDLAQSAVLALESAAAVNDQDMVEVAASHGIRAEQPVNGDPNRDDSDFAGAVFVGYNYQMNNRVFGIERDLNFRTAEPEDPNTNPFCQNLGGSVRGRIGYAFDRIIPYLTAGPAIANFEADHHGDGDVIAKKTMTGYGIGAGVERAVTDNFIVRG